MDRIRYVLLDGTCCWTSCCRCLAGIHLWDQVAGHPYCPNCQEALALGEAPPLVERTEPRPCAVCARRGTIRFLTFPQNIRAGLEIDLCGEHLRGLLGRRLGPYAFIQLRRLLRGISLDTDAIFLLHGEFYNTDGHALRPAVEADAGGAEE